VKKNLSILIYSLGSGGAERVTSILLSELRKKYNITLVLMNTTIFYTIPDDVQVVYIEKSFAFEQNIFKLLKLPFLAWKYKKICEKQKIDISLSLLVRPNYINVLSKLMGSRAKCIISERSFLSEELKNHKIHFFIRRTLVSYLYNKADVIVGISKGTTQDLIEMYKITPEKTRVIYNPIDLDFILKEKMNKNLISKQDEFVFVTIGRLDKGKNHELLIKAIEKLKSKKIKLLIIGDGLERKSLENLINQLNVKNKVEFLGLQKNPFQFLFQSDCFVFATNYESFGNVLVEALACELPIISTDCKSGPREVLAPNSNIQIHLKDRIEKEEYGILTPVNDLEKMVASMELMLMNSSIRNNYKEKSQKRANDFHKNKIIQQWLEVFEK